MQKSNLRKIYLARQKSLTTAERTEKSRSVARRFFENFDLRRTNHLHSFLPIEKFNEVETDYILKRIWRDFPPVRTSVPRVNFQTFEMENLAFASATKLVQNAWQIREPAHDERIETERLDLVLVPLLCFDRRGYRVGYGKGFYDRFLKNCRADCVKIGLSYFAPVREIADAGRFDVRLDFCLTPEKIWKFTNGGD